MTEAASGGDDTRRRQRGEAFVGFALEVGALRLGEFTLKSGRTSPYFFDSGAFSSAHALARLGSFYAATLVDAQLVPDVLFGPAYKGIPLAAATAVALASEHGRNCGVTYNRKEEKDHGEGGRLVGARLAGRVVLIDDVMTAGTAVREVLPLIEASGASLAAIVIALDREERTDGRRSAVQTLREELGVPVVSIARFRDLLGHMEARGAERESAALTAYRRRFGAGDAGEEAQ